MMKDSQEEQPELTEHDKKVIQDWLGLIKRYTYWFLEVDGDKVIRKMERKGKMDE